MNQENMSQHSSAKLSSAKLSNGPIKAAHKTILDYASHTTIHGIAYIFDTAAYIFENILWLLAFGISASFAIYSSLEAYNHWQTNPVLTSVKTTGSTATKSISNQITFIITLFF